MKKLMIAACAIALAGAVQAGSIKWSSYGIAAEGCSDQSQAWSGTVYLMNAGTQNAANFFAAYAEAGANQAAFNSLVSGAMSWATQSSEAIDDDGGYYIEGGLTTPAQTGALVKNGAVTFGDYASGTAFTLYQVAFDAASGALFISEDVNIPTSGKGYIPTTGSGEAAFYNDASLEGLSYEVSGGFQGSGWYTAVPEPTSGLLLLLGVAGLALRRRRA